MPCLTTILVWKSVLNFLPGMTLGSLGIWQQQKEKKKRKNPQTHCYIFELWERNKSNNTYKNIFNSPTLISWELLRSRNATLCLPHLYIFLFKSYACNSAQRGISTCLCCLWEKRQAKRRIFCCAFSIRKCTQLLQICYKGNIWKESFPGD